ncbi:Enoyl-CoA hydratase/isomerase family protein [Aphelenchoides bicaudatus]|nr:Enoyl-CoA hydratase/isomerase family protein [Aphelenchoides bicaudatus]
MISCADIRYAVSDAQFSIKEPDVGLTADVGILQRLQKITGNESWAREIAFTARSFSGSEALNFGLVSRIFDNNELCLSSALDLAEEIASKSPVVTYGTKLAMNYSRDHTIQDSLEWIRNWNSAHLQTQDMNKIAEAMMSKKKPVFEDVLVGMLNTGKFAGKTLVISGASRGIGRSIALKLAKDGANVAILAKTAEAHAKLPGTIYSVAEEIEKAGGKALPCAVDIRDEKSCERAIEETVKKFGGIDICCNNASAISLTGTTETPMKKYDLMNSVNTRGTFLLSKLCIPYLKQSKNAHILTLSPPLLMDKIWFSNHVAYTIAKYGMSMCTLGMAEELKPDKIAVNSLWPQTQVWTAAMKMLSGGDDSAGSRIPEIVADAAYAILSRRSTEYTGNFAIDEEVLREEGVTDFEQYACNCLAPLNLDFFIPGASAELPTGGKHAESRKDIKTKSLEESIKSLKGLLHDEEVKKLRSVFEFKIQDGDNLRTIHMDLANAKLNEGSAEKANVIFTTDSNCFVDMLDGHLKPSNAFMSQKLKIKGDITAALKLEKLLGKLHKKK